VPCTGDKFRRPLSLFYLYSNLTIVLSAGWGKFEIEVTANLQTIIIIIIILFNNKLNASRTKSHYK